jgi:uncharacterized protein (DUF433 family)
MNYPRISVDPKVMVGKPCIAGTRIMVEHILRRLSEGMSPREYVRAYPTVTIEDIRAAQAYASESSNRKDYRDAHKNNEAI